MEIYKEKFGSGFDGTPVDKITVINSHGVSMQCMSFGASLISLKMPGRNKDFEDVVLGFDKFDDYLKPHPYIGASIGRVAGRIAQGGFSIGGRNYQLEKNSGRNHIHGGRNGFDKYIWTPEIFGDGEEAGVVFRLTSPDGDQGYPGKLTAQVTYALNDRNELALRYSATTEKNTPVNLSNHIYWNLGGKGSVLNHKLRINARQFLPEDEHNIPMGEPLSILNTPMDFSHARLIGRDIKLVPGGYNQCFIINEAETRLRPAAILNHPESGRTLELYTTKPGLVMYPAVKMPELTGKKGMRYGQYSGVVLQPTYFPDFVNQGEASVGLLRPKEEYEHETVFRLSVR